MENNLAAIADVDQADMDAAIADPKFGEVWRAQMGYQYGPIRDAMANDRTFGDHIEQDWNAAEHITPELAPFASTLGKTTSQEHFDVVVAQIGENMERRETMARGTLLQNLGAGMLDPINLIPIGGVTVGVVKSAKRGAMIGGLTMAGLESVRAPFDPLATPGEVAINVTGGAVFGGMLTGASSIPRTRIARAIQGAEKEYVATSNALTGFTQQEFAAAKAARDAAPNVPFLRNAEGPKPYHVLSQEQLATERAAAAKAGDEAALNAIDLENTFRRQDMRQRQEAGQTLTPDDQKLLDPTPIENAFMDSWLYKGVTTPMKRVLSSSVPVPVKSVAARIAGDGGVLARANQLGHKLPLSVYQRAKLWESEFVRGHDKLVGLWAQGRGGATVIADQNVSNWKAEIGKLAGTGAETYEDWVDGITRKYIAGVRDLNPHEEQAVDVLRKFFSGWEERAHEAGVLGQKVHYEKRVASMDRTIGELRAKLDELKTGSDMHGFTQRRLDRVLKQRQKSQAMVEELSSPILPRGEDVFFPRFWDKTAVRRDRVGFESILRRWFKENPDVYVWKEGEGRVKVKTDRSPAAIARRAKETADRILGDVEDELDVEATFVGTGKAKHAKSRDLDIPNHLVMDFMHTNSDQVMHAYNKRMASRYEFNKAFDGQDIDDVLDEARTQIMAEGGTLAEANKAAADIRVLHDRVVGTTRRNPNSWRAKTANTIRDMAMLNYLGSTGLTAMVEPAHIIKEHGMANTFRGVFGFINDNKVRSASKHVRLQYAEALEGVVGSTGARFAEDMTNNPFMKTVADRAKNGFFLMNGLTPITQALKHLDAIARGDTFHRYMTKMVDGTASEMETQFMLRHNIDVADAKRILAMPWETSDSGMKLPSVDQWTSEIDVAKIRKRVTGRMRAKKRAAERIKVNPFDDASKEAFMKAHGKDFFVDFVQTNKEIVEGRFNRRFKEKYGTNVPEDAWLVGFHEYFDDGPGTIYLHQENIRKVWEFQHEEVATGGKAKALKELDDARARGDVDEEAYVHHKSFFENADLFDTVEEFEEFIMMHEMHHGIIKRKPGQSLVELEAEVDAAAVQYLRGNRKATIDAMVDAETKAARADADEVRVTFNSAMSTGILNTILMGTPADKPTIVDGVVLIPNRVAGKFGLKPDPKYAGYARIEDPLLGLPFQFYSYALAAVNKITGAYATGQVKHRAAGIAAAMVLGYMVLDAKTPDFAMDRMTVQDKVSRAFDMGGLAPIYSDMMYTGLTTTLALGGPNVTGGLIQPKFKQEKDVAGGAIGLAGAGPNLTYDLLKGSADLVAGDHGDGAKQVIRNLPFMRLWFIKDQVNQMTMGLDEMLGDGQQGGRF